MMHEFGAPIHCSDSKKKKTNGLTWKRDAARRSSSTASQIPRLGLARKKRYSSRGERKTDMYSSFGICMLALTTYVRKPCVSQLTKGLIILIPIPIPLPGVCACMDNLQHGKVVVLVVVDRRRSSYDASSTIYHLKSTVHAEAYRPDDETDRSGGDDQAKQGKVVGACMHRRPATVRASESKR